MSRSMSTRLPSYFDMHPKRQPPPRQRLPSLETVAQVFGRPPIYDGIFGSCSAASLPRLAATSRDVRAAFHDFERRAFNVNRRLKRFVDDPAAFRTLMGRTGMIISGSFALQFFDRTLYEESDLDCYLYKDRSILQVGAHLKGIGYVYKPNPSDSGGTRDFERDVDRLLRSDTDSDIDDGDWCPDYGSLTSREHRRICAVYSFERKTRRGSTRRVQLVVSMTSPFAVVLSFHSTCVMNVITYNVAYALYPRPTFEFRHAIGLKEEGAEDALAKYTERGWTIFPEGRGISGSAWDLYFFCAARWVCDDNTWKISLDMTGVAQPPPMACSRKAFRWDPTSECGWELDGQGTSFKDFDSPALRWKYTLPGEHSPWEFEEFMESRTTLNKSKLAKGSVPPENVRDSCRPPGWKWWDAQMPLLRKAYMVQRAPCDFKKFFRLPQQTEPRRRSNKCRNRSVQL
ncbi:uncharacterized protein BXZ73DRAFT_80503 [Epithele typhae]|uniref:uncharacterized protein n=1 Tax=Epithele typhae TaxID=378194 RepID=UPI0020088CCF|nr:uncharacterized protein BXZ73DRAFT_80503 [Epithele typhae]KAH9918727.1 hypothetical protein BXZ73DRAFT_80503 [Epithele typhae]